MATLAELSAHYAVDSPHGLFARMRRERPVSRIELPTGASLWLVTRYGDARVALADARLRTRIGGPLAPEVLPPDIRAGMGKHMLRLDGADHLRLRRLVSGVFTARRIRQLRPRVVERTAAQLDVLAAAEAPDVVRDVAFPLPLEVIHELLGVPVEDQELLRGWSTASLAGLATQTSPGEVIVAFVRYLRDLVARKRAAPDDRLLSAMIAASDDEDRLDEDELTSMCFLLVVAGYEPVMNLIGTAVHRLLVDPALADRLRADPAALPAAVEEFLRHESPTVGASFRVATEDLEIGGQPIAAGDRVAISLLSANRDDATFDAPDAFDAARTPNPHLAFGHGIHFCLGAPLARMEVEVVVDALLHRFPGMALADPDAAPLWWPGPVVRGLATLPVTL